MTDDRTDGLERRRVSEQMELKSRFKSWMEHPFWNDMNECGTELLAELLINVPSDKDAIIAWKEKRENYRDFFTGNIARTAYERRAVGIDLAINLERERLLNLDSGSGEEGGDADRPRRDDGDPYEEWPLHPSDLNKGKPMVRSGSVGGEGEES